jgi:phthiocerol/phenolphthiocerol synthesis type-I polyketide synthase E
MSNDMPNLDVAMVGIAGRFPGASTVEAFWCNLCAGVESVTFFTDEELRKTGVDPAVLEDPSYVKASSVLDDPALFDASFFGYSPREADLMDPQHRFFLECAWEALEDAGYDPDRYEGAVGVYGGASINSYLLYSGLAAEFWDDYLPILIGGDKDFLATRVSYKLNLRGPSVTVQCGCSTSLVAVHMACQSLLTGECDMALAGGVSVRVPHRMGYFSRAGSIHSPDGHCRAFDADAQGTIFGSGVGIVVLKRLAEAVADADHIYAVIKGSAVNNDGAAKVGYTAPSVQGQSEVVMQALANSGVPADTVTYIEAHGTGTTLGDPVELQALTDAFRAHTGKKGFCAIGSVKTNIGHLDAAAGVAGLIKTALALKHGTIPPSLHFQKPNPQIDFQSSPFYVVRDLCPWQSNGYPRRAGVSALGVGGTNAHVILEEPVVAEPSGESRAWQLLLLSARTEIALNAATANLAAHLERHSSCNLSDVAYTLQVGRKVFDHRRMVVCQDIDDAIRGLRTLDPKHVRTAMQGPASRDVAFLFSGQGSQYVNMGRGLYHAEPVFRREIDGCSEILKSHLPLDLHELLYPQGEDTAAANRLTQTSITQPVLFVFEYALATLWMSWGITPQVMAGHSIGEYVAACLAGVFSLEQALSLVATRGRLMQELPQGSMLAVPMTEEELVPLLGERLSLATVNGPSQCVASGETEAVDDLEKRLLSRQVQCRRLHTSHAFHSAMVEPVMETLAAEVGRMTLHPPQIPFASNVTGTRITSDQATSPDYWATHLRHTVRFSDCIHTLMQQPNRVFLEVGPGRTLSTLSRRHPSRTPSHVVLSCTRHPQEQASDEAFLLDAVGQLWLAGLPVDWPAFHAGAGCRRVPLPTYPFEHKRYWIASAKASSRTASAVSNSSQAPCQSPSCVDASPHQDVHRADGDISVRDTERCLVRIWQNALGLTQVSPQDDFFDLGGNSLTAVQVIAQIRKMLGVKLSVRDLFESPTVSQLAGTIDAVSVRTTAAAGREDERLKSSLKQLGCA